MVGLLKVGHKKLFLRDPNNELKELTPLCILDFYVYEPQQRQGIGKELFDAMLSHEGVSVSQLAHDRPSPRLMSFLARHFNLDNHQLHENGFVVFPQFWSTASKSNQQHRTPGRRLRGMEGSVTSSQEEQVPRRRDKFESAGVAACLRGSS